MADEFDAIITEEFKDEVVISANQLSDYFATFLRLLDGAKTVGAVEVWDTIEAACPWFGDVRDDVQGWVVAHRFINVLDPIFDDLTDAIKAGLPVLAKFMADHELTTIHHWTPTPWGFIESTWGPR